VAYGNLLVFKTIRVGFPTARIEVVDSGSHKDMVPRLRAAALDVGAFFEARPFCPHSDYWAQQLLAAQVPDPDAAVVFVDPDTVWWENCEGWDFGDALMAGRVEPERRDSLRGIVYQPRIHPSVVWVPSMRRLRSEIATRSGPGEDVIGPRTETVETLRRAWLTLAPLYGLIGDRCKAFGEAELDGFDHLTLGSNLPTNGMAAELGAHTRSDAHRSAARGDIASLRGLWRLQEAELAAAPRHHIAGLTAPVAVRELAALQGIGASDVDLPAVAKLLQARYFQGIVGRRPTVG
jgi:hypothetical protein